MKENPLKYKNSASQKADVRSDVQSMIYLKDANKDSVVRKPAEHIKANSKNIIEQMFDGIVGKEKENPTEREKEIRRNLSGRALEYLMFADDDE